MYKNMINKKLKRASTPGTRKELKEAVTPSNGDIYEPGVQVKKALSKKTVETPQEIVENII